VKKKVFCVVCQDNGCEFCPKVGPPHLWSVPPKEKKPDSRKKHIV